MMTGFWMSVKPICSFADRSVKALAIFTVEIAIPGAKPLGGSMTCSSSFQGQTNEYKELLGIY